ncbi:MAG TPA: class II glutamine amidotransferase [Candidatus Thermoplasmatota archaeon]|nr:class II glutamine amidotransferase [Candidatus Thermoplasmatota archaeon]
MCRLFAFLGSGPERLDQYLCGPEPSLRALASEHGDGWGIARFAPGHTDVVKRATNAGDDPEFLKATEGARATALLAHIRWASVGSVNEENTHPFRHGPWAFSHNGTVPFTAEERHRRLAFLPPELRARIRGTTDSELVFHLILADLLAREGKIDVPVQVAAASVAAVFKDLSKTPEHGDEPLGMNFLLMRENGFCITRFRRELSVYQGVGDFGPYAMVASEPLGDDEDAWWEVPEGSLLTVSTPGRVTVDRIL